MAYRKPAVPRNQITMWPPLLDESLPAHHPVRLLEELFAEKPFAEELARLEAAQEQVEGQPGYSPATLMKLCIYCSMERLRSSRRMEQACINRLDVIWLMEGLKPDHATIARFMTRHGPAFKHLLRASITAGISMNLVSLDTVAIDGTFIQANASRKSVKHKDKIDAMIAGLDEVIDGILAEHMSNDEIEDRAAKAGLLPPDSTLPEEERIRIFEKKREALKQAAAAITVRAEAPRRPEVREPNPIVSVTDPESRHIKGKEGVCRPHYNAQMAVDKKGFVVGASLSDDPNDAGKMLSMLRVVKENTGRLPRHALFDAGYHTPREVASLRWLGKRVFVTDPKRKAFAKAAEAREVLARGGSLSLQQIEALPTDRRRFDTACFVYDEESDTYRCPAGQTLTPTRGRRRHDRRGRIDTVEYRTKACSECHLASRCTTSVDGRVVTRSEFEAKREEMLRRTLPEEGRRRAIERGSIVEPRIGEAKTTYDLRRFLRRGLEKALGELNLTVAAMNVRKLVRALQATTAGACGPSG